MRGLGAPMLTDEERDRLTREAARGITSPIRSSDVAAAFAPPRAEDPPVIPLELDEADYTFQAPRIESRVDVERGESFGAPSRSLGGFTPPAGLAFTRDEPPASPARGPFRPVRDATARRFGFQPTQSPPRSHAPVAVTAPPPPSSPSVATPEPAASADASPRQEPPRLGAPMIPEANPYENAWGFDPDPNGEPDGDPDDIVGLAKSMAGEFGPTAKERGLLEEARTADARSDRWRRALRGVGGVLGVLGAGSGSRGIAGLGLALAGPAAGAVQAHNARQERVQGDIDDRMAADQRLREYETQRTTQRNAAEERQYDRARQTRLDDANVALTNARAASETQDATAAELERATAAGDAAGMRAAIRATVNGLNDDSGLVQQWRALVASPDFEGMGGESLRAFSGQVAQLANNRRAGVLEGGGGHGGSRTVVDPVTLQERTIRTGPRRAAAPGTSSAPAGTPRPRPAAAPAATLPPSDADPRVLAIAEAFPDLSPNARIIALNSMISHGFTPEQMRAGQARLAVRADINAFEADSAAGQADRLERGGRTLASDVTGTGVDARIRDERNYNQRATRMSTIYNEGVRPFNAAARAVRDAQAAGMTQADWRAIIENDNGGLSAAIRQWRGLPNLRSHIRELREEYGRRRSGAAIGAPEWANFAEILGMDASNVLGTTPEHFLNAMGRLSNLGDALITTEAGSGSNDAVAVLENWRRQQRRAGAARRGSRGGR